MRREPIYDRIDGLTSGIYFKVIRFFRENSYWIKFNFIWLNYDFNCIKISKNK